MARRVQVTADRIIATLFQMDAMTWFGCAAVVAMMFFYALELRSPLFILAFAAACWMSCAYGYLRGSWQIEIVGAAWGCLAIRKCWGDLKAKNNGGRKPEHLLAVWHIRFIAVLAVISGIVLLVVDSPMAVYLPVRISRAFAEAVPLLLVGVGYLAWLAIDLPPIIDLIKQCLIAVAFILWGVNLLMPAGAASEFVGAVVIAIYVFDLAWLMEGNLRKTIRAAKGTNGCASLDCKSAGVCRCAGTLANASTTTRASRSLSSPPVKTP
jgi:hypothetical protein